MSHLSSEPTKTDFNNGIPNPIIQQQQQQQEIRPHVCEMPDCSAVSYQFHFTNECFHEFFFD